MIATSRMTRAFTLIELLVVVAIIGILSAIVLASLGVARERAQEANVRATLKNMSAEIELEYETAGTYEFVRNCQNTGKSLKKFVDALAGIGAIARCSSISTGGEVYTRWGVAANRSDSAELAAWVASPQGVTKVDTSDANGGVQLAWQDALTMCAAQGKRLPSVEELQALAVTTPISFTVSPFLYWSSSELSATNANVVNMSSSAGSIASVTKTTPRLVRCVR